MTQNELTQASITKGLETDFIGRRIIYRPSLASTMEIARKMALEGPPEGSVIITDEQTAGKGRTGRVWSSPKGCIALSIVLYPEAARLLFLIMIASLAVLHAIEKVTGLKPEIKWPNDILIGGSKVCGILVESGVQGARSNYAIIGIGINVNLRAADLDVSLRATSLSDELGREVSRLELVRRLLTEMERLYIAAGEGEAVFKEWRSHLVTLGKPVSARSGENTYKGTAEAVERDGSLIMRMGDGSLKRIVAGDVTLIR